MLDYSYAILLGMADTPSDTEGLFIDGLVDDAIIEELRAEVVKRAQVKLNPRSEIAIGMALGNLALTVAIFNRLPKPDQTAVKDIFNGLRNSHRKAVLNNFSIGTDAIYDVFLALTKVSK